MLWLILSAQNQQTNQSKALIHGKTSRIIITCKATTGKGCPGACQKDYKSLADFGSSFTLFLDASLIIFSPHAR